MAGDAGLGMPQRSGAHGEGADAQDKVQREGASPSVDGQEKKGNTAVVHVDDFLCVGAESLLWLFDIPKVEHVLKQHLLVPGSQREVKYLNHVPRRRVHGMGEECVPKRARTLLREFGMMECQGKDTPTTKYGRDKSGKGEPLRGGEESKVR